MGSARAISSGRTEEEILRTLDADGRLEGVPFMPEMLRFCGREFRVRARAHKVCDTIEWEQFPPDGQCRSPRRPSM